MTWHTRPCINFEGCDAAEHREGCPGAALPVRTPRPWPDNAEPTPQQLAAWLVACEEWERVETVERMLVSAREARRCFEQNHDGAVHDREVLNGLRFRLDVACTGYENLVDADVPAEIHAEDPEPEVAYLRGAHDAAAAIRKEAFKPS